MRLKATYQRVVFSFFWAMLSLLPNAITAQQTWIHSQYTFSLYDVNAAALGDGAQNALAFRYRKQWSGIEGAPQNIHASYQNAFGKSKITWGAQLMNEEIGAHESTSIQFSSAYRLTLSEKSRLVFALEEGVLNTVFDLGKLNPESVEDPLLVRFNENHWSPQFNAAVFWRSKKAILGFEANRLSNGKLLSGTNSVQVPHFNAVAAYVFELKKKVLLKPSALMRYSSGMSQIEVQTAIFLLNSLWLGGGYRQDFGLLAYAEYQFSPRFRIGYSFDFSDALPGALGQTHEFFLGIQWAKKGNSSPSIRYFQ